MHHVVADGWSMGVFARELGVVYQGLVGGGGGGGLGVLGVQYADFAVWQRERLSGEWLVGELGWWGERLAGLEGLCVPTDRARPAVQGHRGAGFGFVVDGGVVEGLGVVARGSGATLFMVGLAGWVAVLGRWCGQGEVVVGAPIAGRDRAELEGLIGFFVNTLVLRVDVSGDPSFVELVGRVREVALGAYAHAEVPFEKLVEELAPQRDLSRNPLFQVTFQLFDSPSSPDAAVVGGGLEIPVTSSLFDVRVDLWPSGSGWAGRVEFDTDLFDRSSIEALIDRFVWLLGEVARDPQRRIGSLALVPDGQRVLLERWNSTVAPVPAGTVVAAVQAQVVAGPQRVAVTDAAMSLTYRELNRWANRLGRRLLAAGIGAGDLVAVCVERGCGFVAAALGVMKTGAAYVPLDPAYPPARLSHVIAHAQPRLVITSRDLAAMLTITVPVVVADDDIDGIDDVDDVDLGVAVGEHDLAYVIYTSGSTGDPKGVEIEHHSLMNLVGWHNTTYQVTSNDRGSQIASVGFDAAVWEIWPYLATGASIHTANDDTRADPDLLIHWLDQHQITITFIPTPLTETLLDKSWPATSALRHLLTGGDTLHQHPNPAHPYTLVNHYGPTETTVVATATSPTPDSHPDTDKPPTIGTPIHNTTCYIIDTAGQLAGPGQPGELHIGGPSLARGYHNDPELTNQRFITNVHHPTPPRLYRTGDLARWNTDGTITFLGRTDHQLKIRGHRIEPTELETIITTHPHITHTIITTHPHPTTNTPQLTAYITTNHTTTGISPAHTQQVDAWRSLYENTYRTADTADPDFDIRGWNASDTGEPLGAEVMREQVDQTVDRIAALQPRSILEIGCGTGLLLHRLAASCAKYCATDFSSAALDGLRAAVRAQGWNHVELLNREALDLRGIDSTFDVVVLNSVAQYFPDDAYLERTLDGLVAKVSQGGAIFVGDVRNYALLHAFHTSVELARADDSMPVAELKRRIARSTLNEQELLVDPAWFTRFAEARGRVAGVDVRPRRGHHVTELTRFRYDVTLRFDRDDVPTFDGPWLDWTGDALSVEVLDRRLATLAHPLGVSGVPSSRLTECIAQVEAVGGADEMCAVGALVTSIHDRLPAGIDPEALWQHDHATVDITWHRGGSGGEYDIIARPHDHPPIRFPSPRPGERVLANAPIKEADSFLDGIRDWLHTQLPDAMIPTWIVPIDEIPVTEHGKVNLAALPHPLASSAGQAIAAADRPMTESEVLLASVWAATLGLDSVGRNDNFFELGGDSILSIKLATRAADAGLHFSTGDVFQHQTVAELAAVSSLTRRVTAEQGVIVGELPLTPIQHWFFEQDLEESDHFNQAVSLPIARSVDVRLLARAARAVVAHHDALHLRFEHNDNRWTQHNDPPSDQFSVVTADLSNSSVDDLPNVVDRAATRVQRSVSLGAALVRVGLFELGGQRAHRLVIAVHHCAVDGVSWRILLEDLWTAYEQLHAGLPVSLPAKTTSFRFWSRRLAEFASDPSLAEEVPFWLEQVSGGQVPLPRDLPGENNTAGATDTVRCALSAAETDELLHRLLADRKAEINDALLAAAARAMLDWCGTDEFYVAIEGHGREALFDDVDLTRTVGWFTTIYPLRLRLDQGAEALVDLAAVAEQLRRVPRRGIGFGLLRYLAPDRAISDRLAGGAWPSVSFNYLGQLGDHGVDDPLGERVGASRSPKGKRAHLLELNGAISDGRLRFDIYYSTAIHRRETIERLGDGYIAALRSMLSASRQTPISTGISAAVSSRDAETLLARLASNTPDESSTS
jgi:amino acid adenylation domain-containing protein/non-ribosomal peptide synthase protein (TIGR01720 family)